MSNKDSTSPPPLPGTSGTSQMADEKDKQPIDNALNNGIVHRIRNSLNRVQPNNLDEDSLNPLYITAFPTDFQGLRPFKSGSCQCGVDLKLCKCSIQVEYMVKEGNRLNFPWDLNKKRNEEVERFQQKLAIEIQQFESRTRDKISVDELIQDNSTMLSLLKESDVLFSEVKDETAITQWKTKALTRFIEEILTSDESNALKKSMQGKIKAILLHEDYVTIKNPRHRIYQYILDVNQRTLEDCVLTKTIARDAHYKHKNFCIFVLEVESFLSRKEESRCYKRAKAVNELINAHILNYESFLKNQSKK